jgi:monofunctional biosynthetic peptidoglycan transglycosylase
LKRALKLALVPAALAIVAVPLWVIAGLPARGEVRVLRHRNPVLTSVMRQREREAQQRGKQARRFQVFVPLSQVSRHLVHAVLAAEDARFFGHEGVDWDAVKESLEKDWAERRFARGGSTITQQLAKNLFFTTEKSPIRKLRELIAAYWLEQDLRKARILELYLNVIEWGDGVYGCEAAARRYYAMSAAELSEVEAAGLAAMLPSPRRLNPLANPLRHQRAQRRVLWLMARAGYLKHTTAAFGLGRMPEPPPVPLAELEEEADEVELPPELAREPAATPPSEPTPAPDPPVPPEATPAPSPLSPTPTPPSPTATPTPTPAAV